MPTPKDIHRLEHLLENPPTISKDLIDYLEVRFPSQDVTPDIEPRFLDFYGGKRAVVAELRLLHEDQAEDHWKEML